MAAFRKVPEIGKAQAKALLFRNDVKSILSSDFRKAVGCPTKQSSDIPATSNAAQIQGQADAKLTKKASTGAVTFLGFDRNLKIRWRSMSAAELEKLEHRMFDESAELMESLLHDGASEDARQLMSKAFSSSIGATRLAAHRVKEIPPKAFLTPAEVTATAGPRADVFVLPNLKQTSSSVKLLGTMSMGINTGFSGINHSAMGTRRVSFGGQGSGTNGYTGARSMGISFTASGSSAMHTTQRAKTALPPPIEKGDPRLGGWAPGTKTIVIAP
jgi:hypothetical protein